MSIEPQRGLGRGTGGEVRFWKPVPEVPEDYDCAYLDRGTVLPHVHEEWQFAAPRVPGAISIGSFRRFLAHPGDITVVHPSEVHAEHGIVEGPREWWVLHIAPAMVDQAYDMAGLSPRFDCPVIHDRESADRFTAMLRASLAGTLRGEAFVAEALDWLRQVLRHPAARPVTATTRHGASPAIERALG
jgi:hypothetical protein